ncbi:hypothetical protein ABZ137_17400 [Streptomyces bobili]|uniref:hypothetical protein n=1 Tax=Streptomyces bobili TaxID=67280 RepID=UPI0033B1C9E6
MAAAVAVVVAGVIIAVLRGQADDGPTAEQSAFCWGTLKRGDVAALSVHPLPRYASDEADLEGSWRADCKVGAGLDTHGVMQQLQFQLSVGGSLDVTDVWYTADNVAGVSPYRAPITGVPGWVNQSMAGVLLPASCASKLQFASPAYVRLKAMDDQEETWQDGTLQKRMTDVLMTAASGIARQLGCSEASFKAPDTAPRLLQERTVTPGKACGLPGFTVTQATKEYATDGDFRLWSCSLGSGTDAVYFTVTQDPYLVSLNALESLVSDRRSTVLTCEGKQTLVQAGTDDTGLIQSFRAAVTRKAGCA